jgi:hypothetical protein
MGVRAGVGINPTPGPTKPGLASLRDDVDRWSSREHRARGSPRPAKRIDPGGSGQAAARGRAKRFDAIMVGLGATSEGRGAATR